MSPRTVLKRLVMFTYNQGWISGATVVRAFTRFDLWSA